MSACGHTIIKLGLLYQDTTSPRFVKINTYENVFCLNLKTHNLNLEPYGLLSMSSNYLATCIEHLQINVTFFLLFFLIN